ncbi:disease resistance protein RPM1-like [Coffea arabica]|uniref:Disease resistance protein RPM1-like n=1 Tax=Coffea arabica TaxID=13443 RepID=A0ABM4VGK4_COFAR
MTVHIVSFVLNQLSVLLRDEAKLLGGLAQEIQLIMDELGHMKAFLKFAEAKEEDDPRLEEWVMQVQDVAYDVQDIVEEFMLRFGCNHGHGFHGHARKIITSVGIAFEVQSIRSRITGISEGHKRYQSEYGTYGNVSASDPGNNSWQCNRDEALLVEEAKLVGIDSPKQQLICQLLDGCSELKVVSVLGMGGIGKTTLVKKVQEDANVKRQFEILAWATVSQTCYMEEFLKDLIQQLYQGTGKPVPQEAASMNNTDRLKAIVKDFLRVKRYLIVFDDVWDVRFWDVIKFALPEGCCGSRVMLTTRIADVAYASDVEFHSYVHRMQPLSSEASWNLFCKKTFKNSSCPDCLKDVAKRILRKCEGLPLAIVAIGGVLALKDKSKVDEWKIVERSLLDCSDKLDRVEKILSLSYHDLPYHLRTCFLYASIFPEDYQIEEARLIRLWIAEGFIQGRTRMSQYEVARAYLSELTNRSLIQQRDDSYDGSTRAYHIHDLFREIIVSKSSKQQFATTATGELTSWPKKVRRLVIHDFTGHTHRSICFKYLRSLVTFKSSEPSSKSLLSKLLRGGCRLLKVLDLEGAELEELPDEIFKLYHLKFLSLKHTRVKIIPKSIGRLRNLEYLDLSFTAVSELPEEMLHIRGLLHLVAYAFQQVTYKYDINGFKAPNNIGRLLSLEWLFYIEANDTSMMREIGELKQLRRLGITSLRRENGKELCSSLGRLSNLEQLYVQVSHKDEVIDLNYMNSSLSSSLENLQMLCLRGRLEKVPKFICSLQGLTSIELLWSDLIDDPLESLQHLPNLQTMDLNEAYQGEVLCFKAGSFPKLEQLNILALSGLRWLSVEAGAMPNLLELGLANLKFMEEFPRGIQHLTNLQSLYLCHPNEKLDAFLNNPFEDYQRISHIPEIFIWDDEVGLCRHPQFRQ